uniref:Serine/threonine-protein phosphatase 2A 55 kDa regulatory subunit B n=1 Tax=Kalanchoe fedtschenkoi TaxID=63787 RepID=A0A7N0TXD7_KALFE
MMEEEGGTRSAQSLKWKFSQVFEPKMANEKSVKDAEEVTSDDKESKDDQTSAKQVDKVISAVRFDKTGDLIATGDCGGRIVLYELSDLKKSSQSRTIGERIDSGDTTHPLYRWKIDFKSHEKQYQVDYLTCEPIKNKINKITWCPAPNTASLLLSTNEKTIKLWKVQEKKVKKIFTFDMNIPRASGKSTTASATISGCPRREKSHNSLTIGESIQLRTGSSSLPLRAPKLETNTVATCRRTFAKAHDFHINSISTNSDCETFISADELQIHLWNLERSDQAFNIVDLTPVYGNHMPQVITAAEFHPEHCNMLAYGTSKGLIRLLDLRLSALCDRSGKLFGERGCRSSRSATMDFVSSISDIKFKNDGRHVITRDYTALKLWDINMNSGPVSTYTVQENLLSKIRDRKLLEDMFEFCLSGNGLCAATGSYSHLFRLIDLSQDSNKAKTLQASTMPQMLNVEASSPWTARALERCGVSATRELGGNGCFYNDTVKLLNLAWHPSQNLIACALADSLFLYHA